MFLLISISDMQYLDVSDRQTDRHTSVPFSHCRRSQFSYRCFPPCPSLICSSRLCPGYSWSQPSAVYCDWDHWPTVPLQPIRGRSEPLLTNQQPDIAPLVPGVLPWQGPVCGLCSDSRGVLPARIDRERERERGKELLCFTPWSNYCAARP